jgi:hypothetical protein
MRKILLGLVAAAALFGGLATAAEAKVTIYFGSPYYSYRPGPDYFFYPDRGWYRKQLTCNQARRIVRNRGYDNVRVIECQGRTYTFRAVRPNGKRATVYVNSHTGAVWRG